LFGGFPGEFETRDLIQRLPRRLFLVSRLSTSGGPKAGVLFLLVLGVHVFQGAIQALAVYFAKNIPKEKSSEYFGFFDISGKEPLSWGHA
jgi:UMF1 family MFS transporter